MTAPRRLPKNLRRRVAVERSYEFLGHELRPGMAEKWPENLPIWDMQDGAYVTRARTHERVPVANRCGCGHRESAHGTDRRGRAMCFGSTTCGCSTFRPQEMKK